ncbi:MAG: hypothetical protein IPK80_09295 [Nannocystis sp.]|nr:hypothetical protein [Nannocystis sp.]
MTATLRSLALVLAVSLGCAPTPPASAVAWFTALAGIALEPAATGAIDLRWRPPSECAQVYRISIDEDVPEHLQRLTKTPAEHSHSYLAIGPDRLRSTGRAAARPGVDDLWQGALLFRGPKTHDRELRRELFFSGALIGPASPDAACFERTWDPIEDALALGWPRLPARLVAVGESWSGARVESRCNKSACIDPESGAGGPEAHHLACVTMSWRERLDGVFVGRSTSAQERRLAAISSVWSDGQPPGVGISTERVALVASDSGRLVASEVLIRHGFLGVTRRVVIEAVDDCADGLPTLGWRAPADDAALTKALNRAATELRAPTES